MEEGVLRVVMTDGVIIRVRLAITEDADIYLDDLFRHTEYVDLEGLGEVW